MARPDTGGEETIRHECARRDTREERDKPQQHLRCVFTIVILKENENKGVERMSRGRMSAVKEADIG